MAGSSCTALASEAEIHRWIEGVEPVVMPLIAAYDVPLHEHAAARRAIAELVDDVLAKTVPECAGRRTSATRQVWKWLWCAVVTELVLRGRLDEELDDVLALCTDPGFDPQVPRESEDAPSKPPTPAGARPLPPFPMPMDGSTAEPPANVWTASSRQELAELGVMRLMEGTAGGAPIMGPAARLVLLAFNPVWPAIEQARADMQRLAVEHPGLSFVEVSFADTQRHFGKPLDVHGIAWALASTAPDGRVYASPIVRNDPRDPPPTAEQWSKVIAHASGYVGFGRVRTIVRPRRFGDVVRAMARARRKPAPVTPRARPAPAPGRARKRPALDVRLKNPSGRHPRRRGG